MSDFRVLISSVSAKVAMIQAVTTGFRQLDAQAEIIGADANGQCVGRHFTGGFWQMPRLESLTTKDFISQCQAMNITHIIPSRDGELGFYAQLRDELDSHNIKVMIAEPEVVSLCLDKLSFYSELKEEFPVIPTLDRLNSSYSRWVVKARYGAGSDELALDVSTEEASQIASGIMSSIYQPYIEGTEYSVDLYFSKKNGCRGYVVRSRDKIVAGESVITTSHHREDIGELAVKLGNKLGLYGHNLVQIIEDKESKLHIVEVNPRYGGASGLSTNLGLKSFYWFARESSGLCLNSHFLDDYPPTRRLIKYQQERVVTPS